MWTKRTRSAALAAVLCAPALALPSSATATVPADYHVGDLGPVAADTVPAGITVKGAVALTIPGDDGPHVARWSPDTASLDDLGAGRAVAVNDKGQIAGTRDGVAVRWEPDGTATVLGGPDATVAAINRSGTVVGTLEDQIAVWTVDADGAVTVTRPARRGWASSRAVAINTRGDIVGVWAPLVAPDENPENCHVFRYNPTRGVRQWPKEQVSVPCEPTQAGVVGITDSGWTAGVEWAESGPGVWVADGNGVIEHLGTLGGLSARPTAIAGPGIVAMSYLDAESDIEVAAMWMPNGGLTELNPPEHWGYNGSATAVNPSGLVAGWTSSDSPSVNGAFVWGVGIGFRNLPGLVEPPPDDAGVPQPVAVNRRGQVVGTAPAADGAMHAVLWRN